MKSADIPGIRLLEKEGGLFDGEVRYVLIRADSLMGMIRNLACEEQQKILNALSDSVYECGGQSIDRYQKMGNSESDKLLDMVLHTSAQLGWGKWSLRNHETEFLELEVSNSPFAAGFGPSGFPVCSPITGILKAISERITGKQISVDETHCRAMGADTCLFLSRSTC